MSNDLNPCPKCGAKPEVTCEYHDFPSFTTKYVIRCPKRPPCKLVCSDSYDGNMEATIAEWNRGDDRE